MQNKPVALVTGANQGIGLQIAKDLVAHGFTVLVGSRNFERGKTAAKEIGPDARALQLDVTDQASITTATERIHNEFGRLDLLVQNAAISNTSKRAGQSISDYAKTVRPSNVSLEEMRAVWETNVFGVLAVYQAMLPLLRQAPAARIVLSSFIVAGYTFLAAAELWRERRKPLLRRYSHLPCILAIAGSFAVSVAVFLSVYNSPADQPAGIVYAKYIWFEAGSVQVSYAMRADALSAMMLVMVTFISTLIAIYSAGYMHGDPGYPRFFA